jgi:hypothetical protein
MIAMGKDCSNADTGAEGMNKKGVGIPSPLLAPISAEVHRKRSTLFVST